MIVLIGGEKGGTGKSTIATALAALRAMKGRDVLLVDTDIQGSASYWAAVRDEADITPRVASIQKFGRGLQAELKDLAGRYDDVIIDAGGRDSQELRAAMLVAECLFCPITPGQFDVWTLDRMDKLVEMAHGFNPDLVAKVLVNRASPIPTVHEAAEAQEIIGEFEHLTLSPVILRDRIAHRRAVRAGKCVAELSPVDPKATGELNQLFAEVFGNGGE